jgi:hypothetical protein
MNRWHFALSLVLSLALPLCAQSVPESEAWPSPDEAPSELDRRLDRRLHESLERDFEGREEPWEEQNPWGEEGLPEVDLDEVRRRPLEPQRSGGLLGMDFDKETIVRLEAFALPVVGLHVDREERRSNVKWNVRAKTGDGLYARLSFGDLASIGLSGHVSHHRERKRNTSLDAYALYIDGQVGGALNEGPVEVVLYLGLGIGLAGFDFEDHFDDTVAAAGQIRLQTGLRIFEHVEILANAAWFHWGYPGDSIGDGGYLGLGLALRF